MWAQRCENETRAVGNEDEGIDANRMRKGSVRIAVEEANKKRDWMKFGVERGLCWKWFGFRINFKVNFIGSNVIFFELLARLMRKKLRGADFMDASNDIHLIDLL